MSEAAHVVASVAGVRPDRPGPTVVGVAAAVPVGKSTLADELRGERRGGSTWCSFRRVPVPQRGPGGAGPDRSEGVPRVLRRRRAAGLPQRNPRDALPCSVPVYSHVTYDVEGERTVDPADVVIVEGLNVLGTRPPTCSTSGSTWTRRRRQAEAWYRRRFHSWLPKPSTTPPPSTAASWVWIPPTSSRVADEVWNTVNLVNLREHVAPSQVLASCVITLGPDHEVLRGRPPARSDGGEEPRWRRIRSWSTSCVS